MLCASSAINFFSDLIDGNRIVTDIFPKERKSSFFPIASLDGKNNYKLYFRIERDGSSLQKVFLEVNDSRLREEIIAIHYLRFLSEIIIGTDMTINIIARDAPWDFKILLNEKFHFNIEITSIADNKEHFENFNREERFARAALEENIPLYELKKIKSLLPSDEITRIVSSYEQQGIAESAEIKNPIYGGQRIFVSTMPDMLEPLSVVVKEIVLKKMSKNHAEKENTVIIIDNRTSKFELSDYQETFNELQAFLDKVPFKEVWFYTGYYSDNDGNNAEYSFLPLKSS